MCAVRNVVLVALVALVASVASHKIHDSSNRSLAACCYRRKKVLYVYALVRLFVVSLSALSHLEVSPVRGGETLVYPDAMIPGGNGAWEDVCMSDEVPG